MSKAITVITNTETVIDWLELGRMFATDADNDEQALFLHGVAVAFSEMGGKGRMQQHYIRDAIAELGKVNASEVRDLLNSLNIEVAS